jgi:hypothetical protein
MGNNLKNKKEHEFKYKNLLIFSLVCLLSSTLFFVLFGCTLGVLKHDAFGMYGGLLISVPFVVHVYTWGLFCEWKNISKMPIILKGFSIIWAVVVSICYILFLIGV